jgi:hypothetical protein
VKSVTTEATVSQLRSQPPARLTSNPHSGRPVLTDNRSLKTLTSRPAASPDRGEVDVEEGALAAFKKVAAEELENSIR